jgi:hypothetical protein
MILIFSHQNLSFVAGVPAAASGPRLDLLIVIIAVCMNLAILVLKLQRYETKIKDTCAYELRIMQERWHTCRSAAQGS